jgi:hypothetical protein
MSSHVRPGFRKERDLSVEREGLRNVTATLEEEQGTIRREVVGVGTTATYGPPITTLLPLREQHTLSEATFVVCKPAIIKPYGVLPAILQ